MKISSPSILDSKLVTKGKLPFIVFFLEVTHDDSSGFSLMLDLELVDASISFWENYLVKWSQLVHQASFGSPRRCSHGGGDIEMGIQSRELELDYHFKMDAYEEWRSVTKAAAMKAIKQRMENDVDEVGWVARFIKAKVEELDKEVRPMNSYINLNPQHLQVFNLHILDLLILELRTGSDKSLDVEKELDALKKIFEDKEKEFRQERPQSDVIEEPHMVPCWRHCYLSQHLYGPKTNEILSGKSPSRIS
ncbi:hypothetical protein L6452_35299 [Arctium lappa]|uniref:Uncharacterized protein n=1 Tax=Arctium lappa TaxID=4217 RepID=A0ACB8Y7J5_ARCLA|nr:hypothetical protein L6452_35299 [Arctium lappa]